MLKTSVAHVARENVIVAGQRVVRADLFTSCIGSASRRRGANSIRGRMSPAGRCCTGCNLVIPARIGGKKGRNEFPPFHESRLRFVPRRRGSNRRENRSARFFHFSRLESEIRREEDFIILEELYHFVPRLDYCITDTNEMGFELDFFRNVKMTIR